VAKLAAQNRRSLDQIASRCYYYHTLSHEAVSRLDTIRDFLHGRLRTATLSVS
jgi:26S proteasome regulatory subunit N3